MRPVLEPPLLALQEPTVHFLGILKARERYFSSLKSAMVGSFTPQDWQMLPIGGVFLLKNCT